MNKIPKFERTQSFKASDIKTDMKILDGNITAEMDALANSAIKHEQKVIATKLRNDEFEYKKLAYDQINKAYERNQNNPEKLQNDLNAINKELLGNVPFAIKQQSDEWFFNSSQGYVSKAKNNELILETDRLKANTLSELGFIEGKLNLISDDLANSDMSISEPARAALFHHTAEAINVLQSKDASGNDLYSQVDQLNYMTRLKENVIGTSLASGFDNLGTLEEKKAFLESFKNNQLSIPFTNILTGEEEQIMMAEAMGFRGYDKTVKSMEASIKAFEKEEAKGIWTNYVGNVLEGNVQPETSNPLYVKAVDEVYTTIAQDLKGTSAGVRANAMMGFINKTQVAPDQMVRDLKTWVNSSDLKDFETATDLIITAKEQFPQLLDKLGQKDFGVALLAADKIAAGVNRKDAIESAKRTYDPMDKGVTRDRSKEFDDRVRKDNVNFDGMLRDSLVLYFQDDFRDNSRDSPEAVIRYKEIMRTQYELTGNWDHAKKVADAFITRSYKPSVLNNGFITYLPPENFYSIPNVNNKWMRRDLINYAEAFIKENNLNIDPNKVFVYADAESERQNNLNGEPSWALYTINDSGIIVPLGKPGEKAVRWRPDKQKQIDIEIKEEQERYASKLDMDNPLNVIRGSIGEFIVEPALKAGIKAGQANDERAWTANLEANKTSFKSSVNEIDIEKLKQLPSQVKRGLGALISAENRRAINIMDKAVTPLKEPLRKSLLNKNK